MSWRIGADRSSFGADKALRARRTRGLAVRRVANGFILRRPGKPKWESRLRWQRGHQSLQLARHNSLFRTICPGMNRQTESPSATRDSRHNTVRHHRRILIASGVWEDSHGRKTIEPSSDAAKSKLDIAVLAIPALIKVTLHLLTYKGFGFFSDEFYYIACSKRLDLGVRGPSSAFHPAAAPGSLVVWRFPAFDPAVAGARRRCDGPPHRTAGPAIGGRKVRSVARPGVRTGCPGLSGLLPHLLDESL